MPDDPLQPLIDQIAKLLNQAEASASQPFKEKLDPKVEKELLDAEEKVKLFKMLCKQQIEETGKTGKEAIHTIINKPEAYTETEKKIFRDLIKLGLHTMILGAGLERAKNMAGKTTLRDTTKNTEETIKKRKRKFKGMKGDSKWKKL